MKQASIAILNAGVPGYERLQRISIRNGEIASISPMSSRQQLDVTDSQVLDLEGDWLSLGGVDLQINGALGLAFTDVGTEDYRSLQDICQFLWDRGIDAFLPTLVTTSVPKIGRSLHLFSELMSSRKDCFRSLPAPLKKRETTEVPLSKGDLGGSQILGVHLEGPFLNPEKRGAHPEEFLLPLTVENVKNLLGDYSSAVKVMTLAPELDATGEVISHLRSLGITVSLGHSQATEAEANFAFERGASMVTHAFNAMPSLHHRKPGLLGAALVNSAVFCGLIADGQHVCRTMIELLLRCHPQGVFLVSDALAPLGLSDGIYPWDDRQIEVKNGTARLLDGVLAGTTLPLFAGVQNLVKWGICGVGEAIALATEVPRKAIGLPGFEVDRPASLLRWHFDESTKELTWQRL